MGSFHAGQILLIDWRGDALPKEANKLRPCVVIEDDDLFPDEYPNVIVVPLTDDARYVIQALAVEILPTPANGCEATCYAIAHAPVTASKARVRRATSSRISTGQLRAIRQIVTEVVGADA